MLTVCDARQQKIYSPIFSSTKNAFIDCGGNRHLGFLYLRDDVYRQWFIPLKVTFFFLRSSTLRQTVPVVRMSS